MSSVSTFIINNELEDKPIKSSVKIAAFDLDYTLIKTKSGKKFPVNKDDWVLIPRVKERLNEFYDSCYKIVIFTNQAGSSFNLEEFKVKIKNISKCLNVPLQVFGCTDHGMYRKPSKGMWFMLCQNNDDKIPNISESFYVGDAAGRPGDFSDSDLKFALNIGVKFYSDINMTEEKFPKPLHPLDLAKKFDENLIFLKEKQIVKPSTEQELIILVGPPASGKSTFCKNFEGYVVANQDTLKTKNKVITVVKKSLKEKHSVIVDRKNEYIIDRNEFIQIASEYNIPVRIVWFDVPKELCKHLAVYRNIMTGKYIPEIVFNKYFSKEKGLQIPTEKEGAEVIKLNYSHDDKCNDDEYMYDYLV